MVIFSRVGWLILLIKSLNDLFLIYQFYLLYRSSADFKNYIGAFLVWLTIRIILSIFYYARGKIYLKLLLKRLGESFFSYRIKIIKDKTINAFAYEKSAFFGNKPIKFIGITTGMLKKCSKDEVNFAIAHELSHHRNNDIVITLNTKIFGGMLKFGLYFFNVFKSSNLNLLATLGIELGSNFILKNQEMRADTDAFFYLRKAGLNPDGGVKFFNRLLKSTGSFEKSLLGKIFVFVFSDHPLTEKRLKNQKELLEKYD